MKNTWVKIPVVNNFKFINKLHVAGVKYWSATQFAEFTTKYKIAKYEFNIKNIECPIEIFKDENVKEYGQTIFNIKFNSQNF